MVLKTRTKIFLVISGGFVIGLMLSMTLHNIVTLTTGHEEKFFYLLFVLLFFISPLCFAFTLMFLAIDFVKRIISKKREKEFWQNN